MRHSFRPALLASLGLFLANHAVAQVYQCLDAGGKKVFSQIPCATAGGGSEKLIMRAPATAAAPVEPADAMPPQGRPGGLYGNGGAAAPKDWAAENAAADARAEAAERSGQARPSTLGSLRKGSTQAQAQVSDKQIIANCEANHGARCSSAGEIAQRRMEQRELSPAERQQQQSAVAARRQRQQDEAFNRSQRR
jgi:hypothetical protein